MIIDNAFDPAREYTNSMGSAAERRDAAMEELCRVTQLLMLVFPAHVVEVRAAHVRAAFELSTLATGVPIGVGAVAKVIRGEDD